MTKRARAGIVGYVPGAWDIFHIGHLNILPAPGSAATT
jgi:glycerol-3-phosphate cytidylyltransferase-like family protein